MGVAGTLAVLDAGPTFQGTGSFVCIALLPAGVRTWTDPGVLSGKTYTYRVRAAHGLNYSDYSNLAGATVP